MIKRTISGRNGKGSLAHNRRAFETENVDKTRVHLNIKYCDENLKRQMEQMPTGSIHERLAWGSRKSEMENQQRKKNKTKNRGMEL